MKWGVEARRLVLGPAEVEGCWMTALEVAVVQVSVEKS